MKRGLGFGAGTLGLAPGYKEPPFATDLGMYGCYAPRWMRQIQEVAPAEMIQKRVTRMPDVSRMEKRLQAVNGDYNTSSANTVRFDFPNEHPIDFRGGYIMFEIVVQATGGTYKRLAQGAFSCIEKVELLFGNSQDEIHYYNRIYNFLWNMGIDATVQSTIGYDLLGYGLQSDRNGWGASVSGTSYVLPFLHGMIRQGIMPMHALSKQGQTQLLNINFFLANAAFFVETDGTNPQIQILNLRWHYDEVRSCGRRYECELARIVESGAFHIGFQTFALYQTPLLLANPAELAMNWKGNAINWFAAILNDASTTANPLVNDKMITWPRTFTNGASVTSYQIGINSEWLPIEPIDCMGDAYRAYVTYLKMIGVWKIDARNIKFAAPISLTSFNNSQFLMCMDLRAIPRAWLNDNEMFNNVNTLASTTTTLWKIYLSNPGPPANALVYFFISYNLYYCADSSGVLMKKY